MLYKMASNDDQNKSHNDGRGDHDQRREDRGRGGDPIGQYIDGLKDLIDSEIERKVS